MGHYQANSTNSRNFILIVDNEELGELIYQKWYSFAAEILMSDGKEYKFEAKGFWDSTIELKEGEATLLKFKMGWKGLIIKTYFDNEEKHFLLKLKGLLGNKFVLLDDENEELMAAETDFKWSKLNFDYIIETSQNFDNFTNEKLLLLTILHCINYYMTVIVAAT